MSTEFYGGDFEGIQQHLSHMEELGVNAIYFTPFFPARSAHRYDASSFEHVDPLLGGDEAFLEFSKIARAKGFRIMGDLTSNHCGLGHEWIQTALKNNCMRSLRFLCCDTLD